MPAPKLPETLSIHSDRPKDRIDISLVASIQTRFRDSSYGPLQTVEVIPAGQSIRLTGSVPTFFLKQTAQEMVRTAAPDLHILNEIVVQKESPLGTTTELLEPSRSLRIVRRPK